MSNRMDLKGWSERRPRAWRRGRVLPIWQGSNRTRPLHRRHIPKSIQFDMNSSCETIVFPRWDHGLGRGSVRRPRAWRRGRVLPIWQGYSRIRPLHRNQVSKILQLPEPGVLIKISLYRVHKVIWSRLCCSNLAGPREGFQCETSSVPHQGCAIGLARLVRA